MNTVVIGLGSNIDPEKNITRARELLKKEYPALKESSFIQTKPVGFLNQPDFINGAVLLQTPLEQTEFRDKLAALEKTLGKRKAGNHPYGPRTIDLDILLWNGEVVSQDVVERDFIKNSLKEVLAK